MCRIVSYNRKPTRKQRFKQFFDEFASEEDGEEILVLYHVKPVCYATVELYKEYRPDMDPFVMAYQMESEDRKPYTLLDQRFDVDVFPDLVERYDIFHDYAIIAEYHLPYNDKLHNYLDARGAWRDKKFIVNMHCTWCGSTGSLSSGYDVIYSELHPFAKQIKYQVYKVTKRVQYAYTRIDGGNE